MNEFEQFERSGRENIKPMQIIRRPEVERLTGLSRTSIYAKMDPNSPYHDPDWPKKVNLGHRSVGWYCHEVIEWVESRSTSAAWGA